jgi:hypothetical protein
VRVNGISLLLDPDCPVSYLLYCRHLMCCLPSDQPDSDQGVESPLAPSSYTEKRTQEYSLLLHVKEVIDCGPLTMMEGLDFYPGKDEDLSRKHKFKTRDGKIEGRIGIHGHA